MLDSGGGVGGSFCLGVRGLCKGFNIGGGFGVFGVFNIIVLNWYLIGVIFGL